MRILFRGSVIIIIISTLLEGLHQNNDNESGTKSGGLMAQRRNASGVLGGHKRSHSLPSAIR